MKTLTLAIVVVALAFSLWPYAQVGATGEDGVEFLGSDELRRA